MTLDRLVIEGDIVRHEQITLVSQAPLDSIRPLVETRLPTVFPILPTRPTRYISLDPDNNVGLIVIEVPPRRTRIHVYHGEETDYEEDAERPISEGFNVQFPYSYFVFGFEYTAHAGRDTGFSITRNYLFWRPSTLRAGDETLWAAMTPNVESSGSICWGSTHSDENTLSGRIDDLINSFFVTEFNEDLGHATPFNNSLIDWESESEEPFSYRTWKMFQRSPTTSLPQLAEYLNVTPVGRIAELNPSFINLPELPTNFTVARARLWFDQLPEGAQRRIRLALSTSDPE